MRCTFFGLVAAVAGLASAQAPLLPSEDPFYTPPAGFENTAPGTILKSRTVTTSAGGFIPNPAFESWQLLYRTTALNGSAIATVTTVFKPADAMLDRFVSFHTAEDSSWINCAPSYNYRSGAQSTDAIVGFEELILEMYLDQGYIVSAPDYEGPDSAFAAGHLEGMGVLDSMRAVNNFAGTIGFSTSTPAIVGIGYSGGAIATGWAASLQHNYAPELNVKGWSAGGTPANITGTLLYIDGTIWSGFWPPAIVGLTRPSTYPSLQTILWDIATPLAKKFLSEASENCAPSDLGNAPFQSLTSYTIQSLGPQVLYQPEIAAILLENTMGLVQSETPTVPVYMYHATGDEIIPYANASTLYENWCAKGATVHFNTFGIGGHATTEILGIPGVMSFVASAFAGTVSSGCSQTSTFSTALDTTELTDLGVSASLALTASTTALPLAASFDKGNFNALKSVI